jgi:hypothetical protein
VNACPDCRGSLQAIKLIDWAGSAVPGYERVVRYVADDAERGAWSGTYGEHQYLGQVRGFICTACHRIFLYGKPKAE